MERSPVRPETPRDGRGYLLALASAALLSTTAIFIRYLTEEFRVPAMVLALWRDVLVVMTLLPLVLAISPRLMVVSQAQLGYLLGYGGLLAVLNALWTLSVAMNGAAVATVLVYSSAAFTAILGWLILDEHISRITFVSVVLTIFGCVLVAGAFNPAAWHLSGQGFAIGILSGVSFAAYSVMGRIASQRKLNPWTTLGYTFFFAAVFLLGMNLLPPGVLPGTVQSSKELLLLETPLEGWAILFLLAAVPSLGGFGLYMISLSRLPSSVVNLIATSEPAFTAVFAWILLGERLSATQICGAILIMTGVVVLRTYEWYRNHRHDQLVHLAPPPLVNEQPLHRG